MHSHSGGGPAGISLSLLSGIVVGGIVEFSVVVLGVEVGSHGIGDSDEVVHGLVVVDVEVDVVLEMLEHIHVLLNVLVSSNSREGECLVVELPGVEVDGRSGSLGLRHGLDEVSNVGEVFLVEGS